jgi:hypothetical protein
MSAAAEAVVMRLAVVIDVERWGLLVMEGAEAGGLIASPIQSDFAPNDVNNGQALPQFLKKGWRESHISLTPKPK